MRTFCHPEHTSVTPASEPGSPRSGQGLRPRIKCGVTWCALLAVILFCTGCDTVDRQLFERQKPGILFNTEPITKENVMDYKSEFHTGQRVYYLVIMPKKQESRMLYIQLIKKGAMHRLGYDLYWSKDIRLKDEEVYHYTDYVVPNQTGVYVMKVYSKDKPTKPYAMAQFFVY